MKILIGYDGSACSDAALDDLKLAGLPENTEASVMSVAEVWLPLENVNGNAGDKFESDPYLEKLTEKHRQKAKKAVAEFEILVKEAEIWHADSIFVGANRFGSRVERFLLGSVSSAVAARAQCTVEVVRRNCDDFFDLC